MHSFQSLYLLCLPAIYKRLEISCYKIMFFMAIVDILCLPIIGCLHGYLAIIGGVFCSAPDLIYVSGCVAMGLWGCEGIAAVFLALNRCLEIAMPKVGDFLFKGERTWCWILASLVFGIWFGFFGKPVLFSSLRLAWIFEPHNGYLPVPEPNWYHSKIEVFDDCLVMVALTVLYVLFAFVLWCKISEYRGNGTNTMASNLLKSQKMIFLQVLIVSIIHINASGVYCYMQLFTVNQFVVNMAMYGWFFAHGIPPVIYLTLNKSIRNDCYKSIKVLLRLQLQNWDIG
ncbi:serpentine type 7TM GPCR chemoreceptor srt domain-containing protein [Ditylenchus destructor]|uniref:Serpentine type 7TM GPCR chemoreceptor srt domain-containing protein n=1 Tax=Ditylenchus destructor TaxID=166010 RepID=A0AAD4MUE2_9BILA|nr:serpentine type 7TM GPCR chemoreceptor srt domain-containing protein [Ditylenchus destructor]